MLPYRVSSKSSLVIAHIHHRISLLILWTDFLSFFSSFVHTIKRYAKTEWTQLQWIVEAQPGGDVQTSYRAYAQDKVVELWHKNQLIADPGAKRGKLLSSWTPAQLQTQCYDWVPVEVEVLTYVLPGKSVLKRHEEGPRKGLPMIPSGSIPPQVFSEGKVDPDTELVENAWTQLQKVLCFVNRRWSNATDVSGAMSFSPFLPTSHTPVPPKSRVSDWKAFGDWFPTSENVAEYVCTDGADYYVPMEELFASDNIVVYASSKAAYAPDRYGDLLKARAMPSVQSSGCSSSSNISARQIVDAAAHGLQPDPARCVLPVKPADIELFRPSHPPSTPFLMRH